MSLCSDEVDEDNIVKHIVALQNSNQASDPYEFLEENEVTALRNLIQTSNTNRFVTLDRIRMELEVQIASISQWEMQKQSLEASLAGGNEALIKQYENAQKELERLKTEEGKIKANNVSVVNVTGAGDSFVAGIANGYMNNKNIVEISIYL